MSISKERVSFDDEMLILVTPDDEIVGYKPKIDCHLNGGILHRAFSIFIFNSNRKLLLQQRSDQKMLWPLFWSNSCCSHPRKGEELEEAIHRRLREELGFDTQLEYIFKFQYQASFQNIGSENELCSVYVGKSDEKPVTNINEIAEWKYISVEELDRQIEQNPEMFTPWFKQEWKAMRTTYWDKILTLI
ncbi:MAG: isopentenyl-diphosphate Delta-isomerase [Calditrichia bacterium]